jgi:hypothetical protein
MFSIRNLQLGIGLGLLLALSGLVHAQAGYVDTFNKSQLNSFWTATEDYGTVSLSTDVNRAPGGKYSLKFDSSPGGQRDIAVSHTFSSPQKGSLSVWFYDVAPGQETQYEQISIYNSVTTDFASVGTQDFDAYCYEAQLYNYNMMIRQGPNQNCGLYPQISTTKVQRTAGWHNLSMTVGSDSVTLAIDGKAVFTASGNYSYDSVTLSQSGPSFRPDTYSYWDNFASPVYKP